MTRAFERVIRQTEAMQRSLEALDPLRHARRATEQFARQAASMEQVLRPFRDAQRMIELMRPEIELARLVAVEKASTASIANALNPSLELCRNASHALDVFTAPMRVAFEQWATQADVVRRAFEALQLQCAFVGEFDLTDADGETAEPENASSAADSLVIPPAVHDRLVAVRFLPLRVIDAVADNPELIRGLSPRDFEAFIAELLAEFEFEGVTLTPRSHDGGRDVLATKRVNDIPLLFAFECKQYANGRKVGVGSLRSLLGVISHAPTQANVGVLVTSSFFTTGARRLILSEACLDGKDFDALVKWLGEYRAKPLLPHSPWAT